MNMMHTKPHFPLQRQRRMKRGHKLSSQPNLTSHSKDKAGQRGRSQTLFTTKPHFGLQKTKEDEEGGHKLSSQPNLTSASKRQRRMKREVTNSHHNQTSLQPPKDKGG
jgi:hypothetical protein